MQNAKKGRKPSRLPVLTPDQQDELARYFEGEGPKEPGPSSPHLATVREHARVGSADESGRWPRLRDDVEDPERVEDEMIAWLDEKTAWYATHERVERLSDESANALAAWFATPEADKARAVDAGLLDKACEEYISLP